MLRHPPPPPLTASYDATASGSSKNDTRVYAGFGLAFGVKTVFETMIGIQSADVNSSGNVSGANISASILLTTIDSVKIKVKYINGTLNGQAEIGLGYVFGPRNLLGTVGYNLPHFNVGTDYVLDSGFEPFINVNTLGRISRPNTTYSCTVHLPHLLEKPVHLNPTH